MQRLVGPGLACTYSDSKIIIEDESHQKTFEGVLATIVSGVAGGLLLGYLVDHIGFYLFSLLVFLLAPMVIALMGCRKVILHKGKMKVRRYTRLYLCMTDTQTVSLDAVQQAALRTKVRNNGTILSRVVLELNSGEDFEVTLFMDSFGHDLKSTMVDKINTLLDSIRRGATEEGTLDIEEGEGEADGEKEKEKENKARDDTNLEDKISKEKIVDV